MKWTESTNLAREAAEILKNVRKSRETKGKNMGWDSRTEYLSPDVLGNITQRMEV